MTESTLMEAKVPADSLFPPAPEESRSGAAASKKRAAKKTTAKKAATAAAKAPEPESAPAPAPAAKKATRKKAAASVEAPAPAPALVSVPAAKGKTKPVPAAAPAPVPAPAPVIEVEAPAAKKATAKKAAKKAAKATKKTAKAARDNDAAPSLPLDTAPAAPAPAPAVAAASPAPVEPTVPAARPVTNAEVTTASEVGSTTAEAPQVPASPVPAPKEREEGGTGGNQQQHPHHQGQGQGQGRDQRGGKFRNRWEKRKRFRDRDGNAEGGHQSAPPPERPLGPPEPTEGLLELTPKGYGYLRQKSRQYAPINQDPWVSPELIRTLGLREGVYITGIQQEGHRGPQVTKITDVNGLEPEKIRDLPLFEELKAINPGKRIQLETRPDRLTTRVMDLITPVGRGQRGLIVAPPRAGKTTLLQHIAEAVSEKHTDMHLMILLVDERPEEVTEFRRTLPNAEIHSSSNDSDVKSHLRTAMLAIERAKRLVEAGQHVFMLMDSITRLGRAFNNAHKGGATMSGGVGVGALEVPRRLFAAARNTREAGSLTILATTLVETNSRMDELIFQEFKGTGNLELVLDRKIAEQYIYPAVNIFRSGTRREELLLPPFQMEKIHLLRRGLAGHKPIDAIQRVISLLERSTNNAQMLIELPGRAG